MSKCKVVAVANQKGGVGKTTTTEHLGIGLAKHGKKILLIDLDQQKNLTSCLGWKNVDGLDATISNVFEASISKKESPFSSIILHHEEGIDLYRRGANPAAIKRLMGHKNKDMSLNSYATAGKEDLLETTKNRKFKK